MCASLAELLAAAEPRVTGRVTAVVGLSVTASGINASVGELVRIGTEPDVTYAEVVALDGDKVHCLPLAGVAGIGLGSPVSGTGRPLTVPVGPQLRGRVLDGLGRPMDGG